MYKFINSLKKEWLLFWNDKVGLLLMFALPILLVFIITVIQDSAFKIIDNKQIKLLIVNADKGSLGKELTDGLSQSGMFDVSVNNDLSYDELPKRIENKRALAGLYIPSDFSENSIRKAGEMSGKFLSGFALNEAKEQNEPGKNSTIRFYHDPVLQENYCYSIESFIRMHLKGIETKAMVNSLYKQMNMKVDSQQLLQQMQESGTKIERISTVAQTQKQLPNSVQHNVPAWTIFALFFMVVSLGSNVVKEKLSGSFVRIKTTPTGFWRILIGKQIIYLLIGIIQVITIFGIGMTLFPLIHLPALSLPGNWIGMFLFVLVCAFSAVSYALMIGTLTGTVEQANGIGAISVIIFAALGGIWVPTFMMPDYMQIISRLSPLHWCIDGFYTLFLKNGYWVTLGLPMGILTVFSLVCQLIVYLRLRKI
jgi:ABC-2 type transport system permease protein